MSYHGKYGSGGDSRDSRDSRRHSSSSRRSSPSRHHRSRRSPSPGPSRSSRSSPRPRDPRNLPESFGRIQESVRVDDDLNILQRMKTSYDNSPLADLYICVRDNRKVKIWTRNYKEVRGVMTGYIMAFDKHWNLILRDVDEVYLKNKKNKTPFLRDVAPNENLPDMPTKVPKEKKSDAEKAEDAAKAKPSESESDAAGKSEKKKKKKRKKSKTTSEKRTIEKIFIRGDNVVMICPIIEDTSIEEGEDTQGSD